MLVADDEPSTREGLASLLREAGYEATVAADGTAALEALSVGNFDLVITDLLMPGADGLAVLKRAREVSPQTLVMVATAHASIESILQALHDGVADYLRKPVPLAEVVQRANRLLEWRDLAWESQTLRRRLDQPDSTTILVGASRAMKEIAALIRQVAPTPSSVLITGESGTGKEVVARTLHRSSHLADQLFLPINCGAIPETLLESQLFGHYRGSFTGADRAQQGLFHRAHGGTIFLDEIGEMPLHLQGKLLRAIEEREILPIGATTPIQINVRIIASTNRDLRRAIDEGRFREDLFYRLNVIEIHVPPLRERPEDIPPLVEYLVHRHDEKLRRRYRGADNETLALFMRMPWRGNVRELEHAIEYGMIVGDGEWIHVRDLPAGLAEEGPAPGSPYRLGDAMRRFERAHIANVLAEAKDDCRRAAGLLGIDLSTLYRKVRDLGIELRTPVRRGARSRRGAPENAEADARAPVESSPD